MESAAADYTIGLPSSDSRSLGALSNRWEPSATRSTGEGHLGIVVPTGDLCTPPDLLYQLQAMAGHPQPYDRSASNPTVQLHETMAVLPTSSPTSQPHGSPQQCPCARWLMMFLTACMLALDALATWLASCVRSIKNCVLPPAISTNPSSHKASPELDADTAMCPSLVHAGSPSHAEPECRSHQLQAMDSLPAMESINDTHLFIHNMPEHDSTQSISCTFSVHNRHDICISCGDEDITQEDLCVMSTSSSITMTNTNTATSLTTPATKLDTLARTMEGLGTRGHATEGMLFPSSPGLKQASLEMGLLGANVASKAGYWCYYPRLQQPRPRKLALASLALPAVHSFSTTSDPESKSNNSSQSLHLAREEETPALMSNPLGLELIKFLGSGGSGNVWLGMWHNQPVAVKVVSHMATHGLPNDFSIRTTSEAILGAQVDHPGLLKTMSFALVNLDHPAAATHCAPVRRRSVATHLQFGTDPSTEEMRAHGLCPSSPIQQQPLYSPGRRRCSLPMHLQRDIGSQMAADCERQAEEPEHQRWEAHIVTEYADGGTLRQWSNGKPLFKIEREACVEGLEFLISVSSALQYLHDQSIIHGDLKASNVLLFTVKDDVPSATNLRSYRLSDSSAPCDVYKDDKVPQDLRRLSIDACAPLPALPAAPRKRLVAKVSDFGLSRVLAQPDRSHTTTKGFNGTLAYVAPEVMSQGRLSGASDVYALGVLLWEMASGYSAYRNLSMPQIVFVKAMGKAGDHMPWAEGVPQAFKDLAVKCMMNNVKARPSAAQVASDLLHIKMSLMGPQGQ